MTKKTIDRMDCPECKKDHYVRKEMREMMEGYNSPYTCAQCSYTELIYMREATDKEVQGIIGRALERENK